MGIIEEQQRIREHEDSRDAIDNKVVGHNRVTNDSDWFLNRPSLREARERAVAKEVDELLAKYLDVDEAR